MARHGVGTALAGSVASGGSAEQQRQPAAQSAGHGAGRGWHRGRGPYAAYRFTPLIKIPHLISYAIPHGILFFLQHQPRGLHFHFRSQNFSL